MAYLRNNIDLTLAFLFALTTLFFVPFSPNAIIESINLSLLLLLFCLMLIVAGLRRQGILEALLTRFFTEKTDSRTLARFFIFACFLSSMIITNDVALIIFVPLSIVMMTKTRLFSEFVPVIVLETIAANLGSMLTPIGNPQNLYIYDHYSYSLSDFIVATAPVVLLSAVMLYLATYLLKKKDIVLPLQEKKEISKFSLMLLGMLLFLSFLTVLRLLNVYILPFIVVPVIMYLDRTLFYEVDYKLLFLFVFLFIGVGSLSRLPIMMTAPKELLTGHEFVISFLLSQFVSNVPATFLLAQYTNEARALLLGVNIGGLGTIIASMASVISFKAYHEIRHSSSVYYLSRFSIANIIFLLPLLALYFTLI